MDDASSPNPIPPTAPPLLSNRTTIIAGVVGAVLLLTSVIYLFVLRGELADLRKSSSQAIEAHLKTIYFQTQQVEALDRLAGRVDRFNREFGASLGKLQLSDNLEGDIKAMQQKAHLPDEAKKTLDEFEQSVTAIDEMAAKVKEYERYLGAPATVKHGDTHSQIVHRYLTDEAKLSPQEADQVLRRTALAWELEPGNEVYNLYHEGILLSTVTQGTAKRPPLMAQFAQRQAVQARLQELEEKLKQCEPKPAPEPTGPTP
jgi:hypothetical protein